VNTKSKISKRHCPTVWALTLVHIWLDLSSTQVILFILLYKEHKKAYKQQSNLSNSALLIMQMQLGTAIYIALLKKRTLVHTGVLCPLFVPCRL
jgi:hypothetical protein